MKKINQLFSLVIGLFILLPFCYADQSAKEVSEKSVEKLDLKEHTQRIIDQIKKSDVNEKLKQHFDRLKEDIAALNANLNEDVNKQKILLQKLDAESKSLEETIGDSIRVSSETLQGSLKKLEDKVDKSLKDTKEITQNHISRLTYCIEEERRRNEELEGKLRKFNSYFSQPYLFLTSNDPNSIKNIKELLRLLDQSNKKTADKDTRIVFLEGQPENLRKDFDIQSLSPDSMRVFVDSNLKRNISNLLKTMLLPNEIRQNLKEDLILMKVPDKGKISIAYQDDNFGKVEEILPINSTILVAKKAGKYGEIATQEVLAEYFIEKAFSVGNSN